MVASFALYETSLGRGDGSNGDDCWALVLRFYDLPYSPNGMHGDEAVAGLEAQRIVDDGEIGPYSPPAAGQPAGPLYLFAIPVAILGHTLLAVRFVPAVIGSLTIPLLYVVARRSLGLRNRRLSGVFLGGDGLAHPFRADWVPA